MLVLGYEVVRRNLLKSIIRHSYKSLKSVEKLEQPCNLNRKFSNSLIREKIKAAEQAAFFLWIRKIRVRIPKMPCLVVLHVLLLQRDHIHVHDLLTKKPHHNEHKNESTRCWHLTRWTHSP